MKHFLSTKHLRAFNKLMALQISKRKVTRKHFPNLFVLQLLFYPVGYIL